MVDRWFGSKTPSVPHLLSRHGRGGEILDVRTDVAEAFESLQTELDALATPSEAVIFTTTPTPAAAIMAAIAAGKKVIRIIGNVTLEAQVVIEAKSDITIDYSDGTIAAGYAPLVAAADDPTNALFWVRGAVGAVSTTLDAADPKITGSTDVHLTSTAGVTAGMWLRVRASNNVAGVYTYPKNEVDGSSGSVTVLTEYVRVASLPGSNWVRLTERVEVWQRPAAPVVSYTPCTNIRFVGGGRGSISAHGGSVACAIYFDGVIGSSVTGTDFGGFSKTCVEWEGGCQNAEAYDNTVKNGEVNGFLFTTCPLHLRWARNHKLPNGPRHHANGIWRAMFQIQWRGTDTKVWDCSVSKAHIACRQVGGRRWAWDSITMDDLDLDGVTIDPAMTSNPASAFETGYTNLTYSEYGFHGRITNCRASNYFSSVAQFPIVSTGPVGFYFDDSRFTFFDNIEVVNMGPSAGAVINGVTYHHGGGILFNDCVAANIGTLTARGVYAPFIWVGNLNGGVSVELLKNSGYSGVDLVSTVCVYMEASALAGYESADAWMPHVREIETDASVPVMFGASFKSLPNLGFIVDELRTKHWTFHACRPIKNVSGGARAVGEIVELDTTSADAVPACITPTTLGKAMRIVTGDVANNDWTMVGDPRSGYQSIKLKAATVYAMNDLLEPDIGGANAHLAKTQNTPADWRNPIGRVCDKIDTTTQVYPYNFALSAPP